MKSSNINNQHKYSVESRNGEFYIICDSNPAETEKGAVVHTHYQVMADETAAELNVNPMAYKEMTCYATYLYTICNLVQASDSEKNKFLKDMRDYTSFANMSSDFLIMFNPDYCWEISNEEGFLDNVTKWYDSLTFDQLIVSSVLSCITDSFLFPYYVIRYCKEHEGDFMQLSSELATDFVAYLRENDCDMKVDPVQMIYTFLKCFDMVSQSEKGQEVIDRVNDLQSTFEIVSDEEILGPPAWFIQSMIEQAGDSNENEEERSDE